MPKQLSFTSLLQQKNLLYYLAGYLALFVFTLARPPLLTSFFTPSQLGDYSLVIAFFTYTDVLFFSWISGAVWRYVYSREHSFSVLLSTIMTLVLPLGIVAILTTYAFFYFFLPRIDLYTVTIAFFSVSSNALLAVYYIYLQYKKQIATWGKNMVAQQLISYLLLVCFLSFEVRIVYIFLASLVYNFIFLFFIWIKNRNKISIRISLQLRPSLSSVYQYSFLLILSNICLAILNNGDRFIIDYFKGSAALGIYSQTYGLANIGLFSLIQVFTTIFLPAYNRYIAKADHQPITEKIIQAYLLLFTPVLFCMLMCSKAITTILLSKSFEGYTDIFNWVAVGIYLYGFSNFFEIRLKFKNKIKLVLLLLGIHALLNLTLNALFLPNHNVTYPAFITFLSYASLSVFYLLLNWSFLKKLHLKQLVLRLAVATLLYLSVGYFITKTVQNDWLLLVANLIIAAIIYLLFTGKVSASLWKEIQEEI